MNKITRNQLHFLENCLNHTFGPVTASYFVSLAHSTGAEGLVCAVGI